MFRGSQKHQKKILNGTTLVDSKTIIKLIKKQQETSDICIAGVPLVKDKETEHFLISGTTGSGKTNCFIELLQQIRERGDRAVIVDSSSELFQRFFQEKKDLLFNLPELPKALAEVRKYGGCFVIGLQSVSQLEDMYGRATTQTMRGLTGTKVIFRASEVMAAKRMSEFLGEQEVMEAVESISFGTHQMRDGVSLSDQKRRHVTIPYTDILQLNNLEAYLKLPGNYPIAKVQFYYHDLPASVSAFEKLQSLDIQ